jgi:hypothetical protein
VLVYQHRAQIPFPPRLATLRGLHLFKPSPLKLRTAARLKLALHSPSCASGAISIWCVRELARQSTLCRYSKCQTSTLQLAY